MTISVLILRHDSETTYHPPVANWSDDQFSPAAKSNNSIHGETLSRLANYGLDGAPRHVLEGPVASSVHNFHKRNIRI